MADHNTALPQEAPDAQLWQRWRQGKRVDVAEFLAGFASLEPTELVAVLLIDQSERWQVGERIPAENYMRRFPALAADAEAVVELAYGEFLLREEQGDQPSLEEFFKRFPTHQSRLGQQVELHRALQPAPCVRERLESAEAVTTSQPATPNPAETIDGLPTADPAVGAWSSLGGYRIVAELGRGGMGVVYQAEDTQLHRQVAVKAMLPRIAADPNARQRFLREAGCAAAVEHDNIVPIYHIGEDRDIPYIVMPLLRGQTLENRLKNGPPPTVPEILSVGRDIALGLAAAHTRGLIHRDIKPGNIWLEDKLAADSRQQAAGSQTRAKILDFGLARMEEHAISSGDPLTRQGAVLGTPQYMSPEQAVGAAVDFRTDLYSLGVLLYRMAAGHLPFSAATPTGFLIAHAKESPREVREWNPDMPRPLAQVIMQLLEKTPAHRPASGEKVAAIFEGLLHPDAGDTQPFVGAVKAKASYRRPLLAVIGAIAVVSLIGLALWWNREPKPLPPEIKPVPAVQQPGVRVKTLRVMHYAHVLVDGQEKAEEPVLLGSKALETNFNDDVKIAVELTMPGHAYLLAFNADGAEQLLWPLGANRKPDADVAPPLQDGLVYPARGVFGLNDDPGGGLQVFAVVASLEPLPSYNEWKKARGPVAWPKQPPGHGIWSSDGAGVYPVSLGSALRGTERDLPGAPPLLDLSRSLQKGAPVQALELLAFPVRAKEDKR